MCGFTEYNGFFSTFFLYSYLLTISGQTIKPHRLCEHTELTVEPGSWGAIEYRKDINPSPASCQLTLNGFTSNRHISLPGLDLSQPAGNCHTNPKVTVNNLVYCVKGDKSNNKVVIQLVDGQMVVKVDSRDSKSFSFNYYSNVAACGQPTTLMSHKVSKLSVMMTNSFDLFKPHSIAKQGICSVTVIDLPRHATMVRLDLLNTNGSTKCIEVGNKHVFTSLRAGSSLLMEVDEKDSLNLSFTINSMRVEFFIRFTVLYCGDVDGVAADDSLPDEPWLPGAKVNPGYSCKDHWKLNKTNPSPIECKVNDITMVAEWINNMCIPVKLRKSSRLEGDEPVDVHKCVAAPHKIPHATFEIFHGDLQKAVYSCQPGFSTSSTISERTALCGQFSDSLYVWKTPSIVCKRNYGALVAVIAGVGVVFSALFIALFIYCDWTCKRCPKRIQKAKVPEKEPPVMNIVLVPPSTGKALTTKRGRKDATYYDIGNHSLTILHQHRASIDATEFS